MGNILSPSDQGVCMSVDKDRLALFGGSPARTNPIPLS